MSRSINITNEIANELYEECQLPRPAASALEVGACKSSN